MPSFRITNNLIPEGAVGRQVELELDDNQMAKVVMIATGDGLSAEATARAMGLTNSLREVQVGDDTLVQHSYLTERLNVLQIDMTFTRLD